MIRVFIDTSIFVALAIKTEQTHQEAREKYTGYKDINAFFYTNDFVLGELYTRLIYKNVPAHSCAKLIKDINNLQKNGKLQVFQTTSQLFRKSEEALIKFVEHKLSFTDATIYTCMKEFKLNEVFTLDEDFKKIGLQTSF